MVNSVAWNLGLRISPDLIKRSGLQIQKIQMQINIQVEVRL